MLSTMAHRYPAIPIRQVQEFVKIVRQLRRDCPWDRKQTHQSIRQGLVEETYEVLDSLDTEDMDSLCSELGDLLLHIVLHATIAEQAEEFTLADVVTGISRKLVRRHPHVFGTAVVKNAEEVKYQWERIKMKEGRTSLLEGVPRALPSLQRALRVQQRAAKVGFDWTDPEEVWKKIREEVEELHETLKAGGRRKREEEFGDMLFALVNYSRFINVNPEDALRSSVNKFIHRFQYIEKRLKKQGTDIHSSSLEEMDALWNEAQRLRRVRKTTGSVARRRSGAG